MPRFSHRLRIAICCLALCQAAAAQAATSSETLLPKTTKGYISIGDMSRLEADFDKTQLGQLMLDPIMKPFADDFKKQLQRKWTQSHQKLGVTMDEIKATAAGEVTMAVILPSKTEAAFAFLMDVHGKEAVAAELLEKIAKNLAAQQAKRSSRQVHGATVTVFDIPKKADSPAQQAVYFIKDDLFGGSDHLKTIEEILSRAANAGGDNLATLPAFEYTMRRCGEAAGDLVPHVRWFLEPFGYTDAMRIANPDRQKKKGNDMLKVLRNQGFTAVQGLGGYVNFNADKYQILHRTAIYAPPVKPGDDKYELAAKMLDFPNGGNFLPQDWVPREIAGYASFNMNFAKAFEASETLVNEVVQDDVWKDIIASILEDPNGPQIDIRKDVIAHLGQRGTVITDYQLPITPKSERILVAVDTTNETALAAAIGKWMKTDPDAKERTFEGIQFWEIVAEETVLPMVTIENNPANAPSGEDEEENEERRLPPNSAVCVAHGHLFVATHVDLLTRALGKLTARDRLAQSIDYQLVKAELDKLGAAENSAQTFSRTDEEYRPVYELVRTNRMPEAETMLGKILNNMLGDGKEGVLRTPRIDGTKLPEFEAVRRYFGPAGATITSEKDGWFMTGVFLSKDPN